MSELPRLYRVVGRRQETTDTVTLSLDTRVRPVSRFRPGQFAMLYAFGVGEVPISVSAVDDVGRLTHTIRGVGAVTDALRSALPGTMIGVRGPYGTAWRPPPAPGTDLVVVAGGIGLAPLRPVIQHVARARIRHGRVTVLIGARRPDELLFVRDYAAWRTAGIDVRVTVDQADAGWTGPVGVVTTLFDAVRIDPATVAYICGPEAMMHFAAQGLLDRGVPAAAIQVSLERNMSCGVGHCGHCQLGPLLLCRDGPVVTFDRAGPLLAVREL